MDEITKVVRDYIVREYLEEGDDREITETTPLISGGIVDSFSMVSLLRFLEKKVRDSDSRRRAPRPTLSTPWRASSRWCDDSRKREVGSV